VVWIVEWGTGNEQGFPTFEKAVEFAARLMTEYCPCTVRISAAHSTKITEGRGR